MAKRRGQDLLITIDTTLKMPIYEQIYQQIRAAIEEGRLKAGDHLPSIRRICDNLCISHTTAERAYLQLVVEGYATSAPRSGYVVERIDTDYLRSLAAADTTFRVEAQSHCKQLPSDPLRDQSIKGRSAQWDFSFTDLAPSSFPAKIWHKLTDDVLFSADLIGCTRYPHYDESTTFSTELASYLHRVRGVVVDSAQLIVTTGTESALTTLLSLFDPAECTIGIEEPGYGSIRLAAQHLGMRIVPLPVDQGVDVFFEALQKERPKIVFTTPSHQFPTGSVLALENRIELLKWANANGSFVIEDDSCYEYRYDVRPIPSLQSLDFCGSVIYLGNLSKILSPSMRVAYMILPWSLLDQYYTEYGHSLGTTNWLTLEVLARFIREGYFDQHVHRMVTAMRKRHDVLLDTLTAYMGDSLEISGINSGIHFYIDVKNGMDQEQLMQTALAQGANVYGTQRYWFSRPAPKSTIIVGFSSIDPADIPDGVAALQRAWFSG